MHADVGDKLVIKGHRVGDHDRIGIIREVRGSDGAPPYVVEWSDIVERTLRAAPEGQWLDTADATRLVAAFAMARGLQALS